MKKVIYIFLLTILTCSLHAQGLYRNTEENKNTSTTEYSPSILRAKPDTPPGPGEDETALPVSGGVLLLAALAGISAHRIHGKNRKTRK